MSNRKIGFEVDAETYDQWKEALISLHAADREKHPAIKPTDALRRKMWEDIEAADQLVLKKSSV